jgi:lipopolysaccharide/colanic/teichoic acid biosynthesis glycosyltransferase
LKRLFDILFSIVGLIISSPIFLCVAFIIRIEDDGPVFFMQERIGRNGKKFKIFKFRSMSFIKSSENARFDAGDSSRVTKTGLIIRKTKIDELPQMLNVLKGEMSFVGPRPEVEKWVNIYSDRWKVVHQVRPGITDNASIEFRNEEDLLCRSEKPQEIYQKDILPRKLTLYEEYVRTQSFIGDIRIILRTIKAIFSK